MDNEFGTNESPRTIGDIGVSMDSSAREYKALIGENLGQTTLKFSFPINEFIHLSEIGNRQNIANIEALKGAFHAQRNLIREHASGLARYTLMGLVRCRIKDMHEKGENVPEEILEIREKLGNPAYASLQPIVTNIRNCEPGGKDIRATEILGQNDTKTGVYNITLSQKTTLMVVDGQHRREGFDIVLGFLRKIRNNHRYPKKGIFDPNPKLNDIMSETMHQFWLSIFDIALTRSTVSVECHLGLTENEEQQLFYDLNSKGRKVQQSLAYQYDHTDPINKFVAEELIDAKVLPFKPSEKDSVDWSNDDGSLTRKDVNNITCLLALGVTSSKKSTPALITERREYLITFWRSILKIKDLGQQGAKSKTVAAQPVVLKAIAKLSYDLAFGHKNIQDQSGYKTLLLAITSSTIDFSHKDKIWTALMMDNQERQSEFSGIEEFVHVPVATNLDAGVIDQTNGWVRFGNRHNDIYPRLGDVIRWKLGLKPRPSVTKAIEEEERAQ
jgi:hypothetical protein